MTVARHLPSIPHLGEWSASAACLGKDTRIFYPKQGQDLYPAFAICGTCPVRRPCLEHALVLSENNDHGIWGGTSMRERRRIRSVRARTGDNTITWAAIERRRETVER